MPILGCEMRPLSLKGHDRALTRVRFNREGDLLISAAKNKQPCLWYTENGERIGKTAGFPFSLLHVLVRSLTL